jgi:hypothetical protein
MRFAGLALPFCLAPALAACTGNVSPVDVAPDADQAQATAAVLSVERTAGAGDASHSEAVARFMRVRSRAAVDTSEALRIVGAAVDMPELGTCVSLARPLAAAKDTASTVQLLDVGAVTMEAGGARTELGARQVPDVVDLVSGVVYSRATGVESLPQASPYTLRVAGSADFEQLAVTATAPADPDMRIAGQDAREGSVALSAAGPVGLAWTRGADGDVVYVDVAAGTSTTSTIRCAFADVGQATLGASAFAAGDDGTLAIHRLHREPFAARGVDSGEIRFDFARVVGFTRR